MIRELKEKTWITKSTRAVFIDFTFYNVNVNLFCICKYVAWNIWKQIWVFFSVVVQTNFVNIKKIFFRIVLEFPPSGGMIPNADFVSLKLIRYLSTFDFFILGLEFFFVAFVVFLSLEIIHNIKQMKIRFFKTMWSYVDITVLFVRNARLFALKLDDFLEWILNGSFFQLSYTYIAYSIARYVIVERFINNLPEVIEEYVEFTHIRNIQMFYNYLIAVLVFFSWVRLLKFITISKTMAHLHDTLRRVISRTLIFFTTMSKV